MLYLFTALSERTGKIYPKTIYFYKFPSIFMNFYQFPGIFMGLLSFRRWCKMFLERFYFHFGQGCV